MIGSYRESITRSGSADRNLEWVKRRLLKETRSKETRSKETSSKEEPIT
jgi:hypothetical protein